MNKRPLLIIKTGSTLPELLQEKGGDFEDWILSAINLDHDQILIVDVPNGESLPQYSDIAGVIIPGSHAMVTDHLDWSERIAHWLPGAISNHIPTLGICYGHQLLAYALGGEVANNPFGLEYGTVDIKLNQKAINDPLFTGLGHSIKVQVSHTQSVVKLPPAAQVLASSSLDVNQAFVVGGIAWGVQFHPEFDEIVIRIYINHMREHLMKENKNPEALLTKAENTPYGKIILQRFFTIAQENIYGTH